MIILETHIIPPDFSRTRFLDYCVSHINLLKTRTSIKKAIKKGELLLDDEITNGGTWVKAGQKITLVDREENPPKPYDLRLDVVFEDEHLAVVHKPAGISVSGNKYRTIQNALMINLKTSGEPDALKWPRPVHRLDYGTSGLLLVAKTRQAVANLGEQFEKRQVKKKYMAVVVGKTDEAGTLMNEIDGKEAVTYFRLIRTVRSVHTEWLSLVELFPETGRTHQIRVHMAGSGHPVLGDDKYGTAFKLLKHKGLFLAAVGVSFSHPVTGGELSFQLDIPYKFHRRLETEQKRWEKFHRE